MPVRFLLLRTIACSFSAPETFFVSIVILVWFKTPSVIISPQPCFGRSACYFYIRRFFFNPSGIVYCFCNFFADERISICRYNFVEPHCRRNNIDILYAPYVPLNLRVLQPGVTEHRFDIGEDRPNQMKQNRGIFPAGKIDYNLTAPVLVPLDDSCLRDLYLSFQRQCSQFFQPLGIMYCIYVTSPSFHLLTASSYVFWKAVFALQLRQ